MKMKQKKDPAKEKNIKKTKVKSKSFKPPQKQKVAIVAQEFKYSRLLAGNEKKTRDKVLKALKKWLINCFEKGHEFNEEDFIRLWKGLFYAVWMSDKPLVQEELCDNISEILDQFPPQQFSQAMLFFKAGLRVLATEWYGIDHHRMDKFLMLVRRLLRASFRSLKKKDWDLEACEEYVQTLSSKDGVLASKTPVYARNALSMLLQIADCYLEELSKVSNGSINEDALVLLLQPYSYLVLSSSELRLSVEARRVFTNLLRQSDIAIEGNERQRAWERMGCPEGGPDALEPVSDDEEHPSDEEDKEESGGEKPLDPRAGRVNVILAPLPVPAVKICDMLKLRLKELGSVPSNNIAAAATRIKAILKRFEALSRNENPLPFRDVPTLDPEEVSIDGKKSALELAEFERTVVRDPVKELLKGVGRRERKRLLSLARSGLDVSSKLKQLTEKTSNGEWKVEIENLQDSDPKPKRSKKKRKIEKEDASTSNKKVKLIVKDLKPSNPSVNQSKQSVNQSNQSVKPSLLNGDTNASEKAKNYNKQDKVKLIVKQNKLTKKSNKNQVTTVLSVDKKKSPIIIRDSSPKIRIIAKESPQDLKVAQNKPKISLNNSKISLSYSKASLNNSKVSLNNSKASLNNSKVSLNNSVSLDNPKSSPNGSKASLNNSKVSLNNSKASLNNSNVSLNNSKLHQTPKRVKFVLKNNSMQNAIDYFKSVRESPNIPFDGTKKPIKTNLKPSTPSPINPFLKKKLRLSF